MSLLNSLSRHSLLYLKPTIVLTTALPNEQRTIVTKWQHEHKPFIVPRQTSADTLHIALPFYDSKTKCKHKIRFKISTEHIERIAPLPKAEEVLSLSSPLAINNIGVFGSIGLQYLTGLPLSHKTSDLDLLIPYQSQRLADLRKIHHKLIKQVQPFQMDAECRFNAFGDVSWQELLSDSPSILVKTIHSVFLMSRESLYERFPL